MVPCMCSASLSVWPPTVPEPMGNVTASWSGRINPGDRFALSCGPRVNANDWFQVEEASLGNTFTFANLVSMRCDYLVAFLKAGGSMVDQVVVPMQDPYYTPKQSILQIGGGGGGGGDRDELWVVFVSNSSEPVPQVQWWSNGTRYTRTTGAFSRTYNATSFCGGPANSTGQRLFRNPGFFHAVPLSQISPGSLYRFGQGAGAWSPLYTMPPLASPQGGPTRFIAYGDMGSWSDDSDSRTLLKLVERDAASAAYHFLLHVGDISYAEAKAFMWDNFGTMISKVGMRFPYQVAVGNHEYDYALNSPCPTDPSGVVTPFRPSWGNFGGDSGGEAAVPMVNRFLAPTSPGSNGIFWYEFVRGLVHVFVLSSEHDWQPGSPQWKWYASSVRAFNRTKTPWAVTIIHRMLYTRGGGEADAADIAISLRLRKALEPLMAGTIDVVIVGHEHTYTRTCSVLGGVCHNSSSAGITHFTVGTAGAGCGPPCPPRGAYPAGDEPWSLSHFEGLGYLRFEATNTLLLAEFVESPSGRVIDRFMKSAQ